MYTLLCVAVSWVLFSFENIGKGWAFFKVMLGGAAFCSSGTVYQLLSYLPLLIVCAIAATPLGSRLYRSFNEKCGAGFMTAADLGGIAAISALSIAFLISGSYNPFLYFRF